MRLRVIGRLMQIQRVLVRHGLDEIILATHLFRPLRYAFYLSPATWFERRKGGSRGERIRLALSGGKAARAAAGVYDVAHVTDVMREAGTGRRRR